MLRIFCGDALLISRTIANKKSCWNRFSILDSVCIFLSKALKALGALVMSLGVQGHEDVKNDVDNEFDVDSTGTMKITTTPTTATMKMTTVMTRLMFIRFVKYTIT